MAIRSSLCDADCIFSFFQFFFSTFRSQSLSLRAPPAGCYRPFPQGLSLLSLAHVVELPVGVRVFIPFTVDGRRQLVMK